LKDDRDRRPRPTTATNDRDRRPRPTTATDDCDRRPRPTTATDDRDRPLGAAASHSLGRRGRPCSSFPEAEEQGDP
jgi:hypothetical protein